MPHDGHAQVRPDPYCGHVLIDLLAQTHAGIEALSDNAVSAASTDSSTFTSGKSRNMRVGTVNLIGSGRDKLHKGGSHEGLCPSGHAGDLGPGLEGLGPGGSIRVGGAVIAAEVEEIVDLIGSGEEALSLGGRLEPLPLPPASSGRLM